MSDAAKNYVTRQGDTVDLIAFRRYGTSRETIVAVLEANRHLADHGPVLPEGLKIILPDLPKQRRPQAALVELWD